MDSPALFGPECHARIHRRCPPGGDIARNSRHSAEHEIENVSAAVRLGKVRREAIRAAVGSFEKLDRRGEIVRIGASRAIAAPLIAGL